MISYLTTTASKKLTEKFKEFIVCSFFLNEVEMVWNSRTQYVARITLNTVIIASLYISLYEFST